MPNPIVHWREIITLDWPQSPKPWIVLPEGERLPSEVLSVIWGTVSEEHGRALECGMLISSARATALGEKLKLLAIDLCEQCLARRYCVRLLQRDDEFRRRTLLAGMIRPGASVAWVGDRDRFERFANTPPPPPAMPFDPWRSSAPWWGDPTRNPGGWPGGSTSATGNEYWDRYNRVFQQILEESYRRADHRRAAPPYIPPPLFDDRELRKAAKTLGVTLPTTPEAVQRAWKKQAKKHHPDLHPERTERSTEKMVAVNVARDLLLRSLDPMDKNPR
jgi:hypothetical protein